METWKLDGFGEVTELLTDELVANVVRHVGSPMTLRGRRQRESTLRIEVDDPSTEAPGAAAIPTWAPAVDEAFFSLNVLAQRSGEQRSTTDGKTVWFEIDVSTATRDRCTDPMSVSVRTGGAV